MPNKLTANSYPALLTQIKTTIASGQKHIEQIKALTYWKVGESIAKHLLDNNGRAGYGQQLYKRLAGDLNIGERTLERAVRFHKQFPIPTPVSKLSWTHYNELLAVGDRGLRGRLERKAVHQKWSKRQLAREIKKTNASVGNGFKPFPARLIPQKGPLNIYQAIKPSPVTLGQGEILIDLGFNVKTKVSRDALEGVRIVNTRAQMSFTYRAYVEEIIDGDTLWVLVDLGFGNYTSQKLRLRGLDCPELTTPAGKRAKAFVQKALKGLNYIIIRSSKSDKYDRYLADIFYGKEEKFLNQELLDNKLAVPF